MKGTLLSGMLLTAMSLPAMSLPAYAQLGEAAAPVNPPAKDAAPQELPEAEAENPYETVVVGSRVELPPPQLPLAITTITTNPLRRGRPGLSLAESLVGLPGVSARNRTNFAQDVRLSVRGFGARSAFGVRGVTVLYDGIPLTMPDGQAQLDIVDPDLVERVEVLGGPAGALYGNAAGGVIALESVRGSDLAGADAAMRIGGYGFRKVLARAGDTVGQGEWLVAVSRLSFDGYRARSEVRQTNAHGSFRWQLPSAELRVVGSYVDAPVAEDSGGLTAEELAQDPRQAAPNNLRFRTGEAITQSQLGALLQLHPSDSDRLELRLWHVGRSYAGSIPFRVIDLDRNAIGGGASYRSSRRIAGIATHVSAALEAQWLADRRLGMDSEDGVPVGPAQVRQDERARALGGYVQVHAQPLPWLGILAGARYDTIELELEDKQLDDGDQSGVVPYDAFTSMGGAIVQLSPVLALYGNIAESFETPTISELSLRPDGTAGLDDTLEPQRARSYEVGARGNSNGSSAAVALFYLQLRDELVPFEDDTARTFYRNAGRSHRLGAEASFQLDLPREVAVRFAYTMLRAEFDEYQQGAMSLAGNRVPGVPPHQLGVVARWGADVGAFAAVDAEYLHDIWADDSNTARSDAATLMDVRAGYAGELEWLRYRAFGGVSNVLDAETIDNLRVNAVAGRYFEPGLPRTFYVGAALGWK